jgi:hypothetical protein
VRQQRLLLLIGMSWRRAAILCQSLMTYSGKFLLYFKIINNNLKITEVKCYSFISNSFVNDKRLFGIAFDGHFSFSNALTPCQTYNFSNKVTAKKYLSTHSLVIKIINKILQKINKMFV